MRRWLWCFILLLPLVAMASAPGPLPPGSTSMFYVAPTDRSMVYLGLALGTVPGSPIQTTASPLIGSVFYVFNQVIFALGILIVIYTTIVGTINTAQEGEFMGREKWHPILVPARAAFGVYLLLPTSTGYCWIQTCVIWFIVQGVGAANALWAQVIYYNQSQGSLHRDTRVPTLLQANRTVNAIFNNNVCMLAFNENETAMNLLGEPISVYRWENRVEWGRLSQAGREQALCGSVTIPSGTSTLLPSTAISTSAQDRINILANAVLDAYNVLLPPANQALDTNSNSNSLGTSAFLLASSVLENAVRSLNYSYDNLTEINQQAIENGWIHAGSYYFQLVQGGGTTVVVSFPTTSPNVDTLNVLLGSTLTSEILSSAQEKASNYYSDVTEDITEPAPAVGLKLSSFGGGKAASLISLIFGPLMNLIVREITKSMTTGESDPIVSIATFGSILVLACELVFWISVGVFFAIWLITSVFHSMISLGPAMDALLKFLLTIALLLFTLIYAAGITMALYIPLIPYFVFTFCALGWIILVIESLLGAPLIGLSLVIPSEDELGRLGHAIIILLGLFLRPILMILGFIFAIQLLFIAIKMLNFGFWVTLVNNTGVSNGVGVFGMVAVIAMYAGIVTTLVHESFSLIYALPNKVLRWIGEAGEGDESAGKQAKQMQGATESGAKTAGSLPSGAINKMEGSQKK